MSLKAVFEKPRYKLLALLLLADAVFIALHLIHTYTSFIGLASSLFSISTDGSYAEVYQYIKEFWISVLLILLGKSRKNPLFLSWAFLFLYLLLDDSLGIHENLGSLIASLLGVQPTFGLRPEDFGELAVSLCFGGLTFGSIALLHFLSTPADRQLSSVLFGLLLLLIFFGLFLDIVDIIIYNSAGLSIFNTIEDAGEMIVMSAISWFIFSATPDTSNLHS